MLHGLAHCEQFPFFSLLLNDSRPNTETNFPAFFWGGGFQTVRQKAEWLIFKSLSVSSQRPDLPPPHKTQTLPARPCSLQCRGRVHVNFEVICTSLREKRLPSLTETHKEFSVSRRITTPRSTLSHPSLFAYYSLQIQHWMRCFQMHQAGDIKLLQRINPEE